jgi:uncharacterized protein with HEPN domain
MAVDAVAWNFSVMGEASANIPEEVRQRHPQVPWRKMRAMRNFLAHVYFGISPSVVWRTATEDLAPTAELLRDLLAKEGLAG